MLFLDTLIFKVDQTGLVEDGSFAELRFRVDVDPATPDLLFDVETVSSGPIGLAIPTAQQEAWLGITHGGGERYDKSFAEGFTLSMTADGGIEFTLPTHGFEGDEIGGAETLAWHGRAIDRGAAPPGSDAIDLWFSVVFDSTLTTRYPLVTGGRVWASDEALIGHDPTVLSGAGYLSRFEGIEVSVYRKAAGTPLYHGQIGVAHLVAAGIPASRIDIPSTLGHPLNSLYEVQCFDGVAEARTIFDTAGYILAEDGAGQVVVRHIAPVDEEPVAEIRIEQFETSEISARISADTRDVPRCWRVDGSRPEIPEQLDEFVSVRRMESEIIEPYTVPDAWFQDAAGALSAARTGTTDNRITSQIWIEETFYRGCLVRRRKETWGQFNPEKWRYKTADPSVSTDGTPFTYASGIGSGYVFGDGAAKDDSNAMRQWWDFQLVPLVITQEDFIRDSADTFSGTLIQTVTSVAEWRTLEMSWKTKTVPSQTFDEENVQAGIRMFAGLRPVAGLGSASEGAGFSQELFFCGPIEPTYALGNYAGMGTVTTGQPNLAYGSVVYGDIRSISKWSSQTVENIDFITQDVGDGRPYGLETRRVAETEGYGFGTDGDQYQYKNGDIRGQQSEEGRDLKTVTKNFVPDGESTHTVIELEHDGNGRFVRQSERPGQDSYLPQTDVCNEELQALASTVAVAGKFCLTSAAGDFVARVEKESIDFGVETDAAAAKLAEVRLRERSALFATFGMPMTPIFYPKAPLKLTALHKGIDPEGYPHASNCWAEDVEMETLSDRRIVTVIARVPVV